MLNKLTDIKSIQLFQLFRFAAVFCTGIILTKKGFTKESISEYETFIFLTYAVSFFWLSAIINTFLAQFPKSENKKQLLFNTVLVLFIFSVISSLFITGFSFFDIIHTPFWKLLLLYILLTIPAYLNEYILLVAEKFKELTIYGLLSFFIHIAIILVALFINNNIWFVVYGLILIALIKFIFLLFLLKKYAEISFDLPLFKTMAINSLPLSISYFLSGSSEVIDTYLVKKYFTEADFAVYRFGARELPIVLILANAFSSAAIPKIAENLEEGLAIIKSNATQLFSYLFPLTVILMFSSNYLFINFFNVQFAQSAVVFNVYLLLIISRLLFPQTILNGIGKNNFLMLSAFLETIINIISSIYFLKIYGIIGIAVGTIVANVFDKVLLITYCKYKLNINPSQYILVSQHLFYSGLLLVIFYLLHYEYLL